MSLRRVLQSTLDPDDYVWIGGTVISRFEDTWQRGESPTIEHYITRDCAQPHALLVELVHIDLERRLQAGEAIRIKSYIDRYPDLGDDATAMVSLIVAEYLLRRQKDTSLSPGSSPSGFHIASNWRSNCGTVSSSPERTATMTSPWAGGRSPS